MFARSSALLITIPFVLTSASSGDVATLSASKDNTLLNSILDVSNGAGDGFYCGRTNRGLVQRGLLAFNLASIPAGSTITNVQLNLSLANAGPFGGAQTINLHRVTSDWGEGTSASGGGGGALATANDATWVFRFFATSSWTTPGGDFVAASSASFFSDGTLGAFTVSGPGMLADVQAWFANPSTNFGWIFINANESLTGSARKIYSKESLLPEDRPSLVVTYTPPAPPCIADFNGVNGVTVQDIFDFLAAWFANLPSADVNGTNGVTVQDIFDFLAAWFRGC